MLTILLGGFTAFGPLSMDLYLPAFPQLAADFGTGPAAVQLTLTADVLGLVIGQLVLGPLSDAYGRRRLLIGSALVCAVASVLCALAPTIGLLVIWRFLQGASGGGGIVLARAIAADIASGVAAARLFSLFMTLSSVAPILAPVLGGLMLAWTGSWQPMFYLLGVISLVLAAATWRAIPESLPADRRHRGGLKQTGRAFLSLARDRVFAGYALTVAFAYASLFGYIAGSSFVLQEVYGLSATQFSLVFALNAAGMVGLGLLNARLVRRFAVRRLLIVGLIGSTVAAAVLLVLVGSTPGAGRDGRHDRGAGAAVRGGGHPWPGLGQRHRAGAATPTGNRRGVGRPRRVHVRRRHPGDPAAGAGRRRLRRADGGRCRRRCARRAAGHPADDQVERDVRAGCCRAPRVPRALRPTPPPPGGGSATG